MSSCSPFDPHCVWSGWRSWPQFCSLWFPSPGSRHPSAQPGRVLPMGTWHRGLRRLWEAEGSLVLQSAQETGTCALPGQLRYSSATAGPWPHETECSGGERQRCPVCKAMPQGVRWAQANGCSGQQLFISEPPGALVWAGCQPRCCLSIPVEGKAFAFRSTNTLNL